MTEHRRPPSALLVLLALLLRTARSVVQYPQTGTDYSAHAGWTKKFLQDERSAKIDVTSCAWTEKFEVGIRDCPDAQVVVGVECASTNCNWKRLRCCSVKGRFKDCTATYEGSTVASSPFTKRNVGMVNSAHAGRTGYDAVSGREVYLHHHFVIGMACAGKNCARLTLRSRKLYCGQEYIIENAVDEMRGSARECRWTKYFSNERRFPVPPLRAGKPKGATQLECAKNQVVTGAQCRGSNCDKLRLYCCNFGHVCPVGSYGNNERCSPCPRGRFGQVPGLLNPTLGGHGTACQSCPKGRYGPNLGASLPYCPKLNSAISTGYDENDPFGGQQGGGRTGTRNCCIDCPAGQYLDSVANEDIWDCKPCPMGKFGQTDGLTSSACTANCAIGRYRDKTGGVLPQDCKFCPPGTWGQTTGLTTDKCTDYCPPGKYNSKVGQISVQACIECPPTFTGSKAKWGEQCVHRMPTRALNRGTTMWYDKDWGGYPDECGDPQPTNFLGTQGPYDHGDSSTGNQGTNIRCFGDFVDYGKSHPAENAHNSRKFSEKREYLGDTAFYVSRYGYPRFCDSKSMCLNVGPFALHDLDGRTFPIGEAMSNNDKHHVGVRTPENLRSGYGSPEGRHGREKYGVSLAVTDIGMPNKAPWAHVKHYNNKYVSLGYP